MKNYKNIEEVIKDGYIIEIENTDKDEYTASALITGEDCLEEVGSVTSNTANACLDGLTYRLGSDNPGIFNIRYPEEELGKGLIETYLDRGASVYLRKNEFEFEDDEFADSHSVRGTLRNFDGKHKITFSGNDAKELVVALGEIAELAKDAYGEDMDFSGRAEDFYK